jgi:hypothetical protein
MSRGIVNLYVYASSSTTYESINSEAAKQVWLSGMILITAWTDLVRSWVLENGLPAMVQ